MSRPDNIKIENMIRMQERVIAYLQGLHNGGMCHAQVQLCGALGVETILKRMLKEKIEETK